MVDGITRSQLSNAGDQNSTIRLSLPVTVLLERRLIKRRFWSLPAWTLAGVAVGEQLAHAGTDGRKVRKTESGQTWSWSGYHITLYKDSCERYWHALIGDKPKVYVICREDIDTSDVPIEPLLVTVDYDEATAYAETDELVLSTQIPAELYRYMESFVLEHYQPKPFKKRKRRNWAEESSSDSSQSDGDSGDVTVAGDSVLTDADMPAIDSLDAASDISGFFSQGVSVALRQSALRRIFSMPAYNVRDGLNDYDGDYTVFEPLGDTVTSDMKYHAARKERERLLALEEEQEATEGPSADEDQPATQKQTANEDAVSADALSDNTADDAQIHEPGYLKQTTNRETTSQISYVSTGHCLITGDVEQALSVAAQLPDIKCTIVTVHATLDKIDKQLTESGMAVFTVASLSLTGYLGAYEAIATAGNAELSLAESVALESGCFDLILDLSPVPLIRASLAPFGYFHAPDADSLATAVSELPSLSGEFEKPRYVAYDGGICAHSRSQLPGCQRCMDVCVTGAIDSLGDGIKVDPFLCQGCGSCATVCPTGAMTYAYPKPVDAIERTRQMMSKAAAQPDVLLLYTESSQQLVDAAKLPEYILTLLVEEVSAFGIDYWTTMLTSGISQLVLLTDAAAEDLNLQALQGQQALLHRLLQGLGVDEPVVKLVDSQWLVDQQDLNAGSSALSSLSAVQFATHGDKRQTLRMALDVMAEQLNPKEAVVALDKGAPFGRIHVDQKACTLCMACVSTCPAKALLDGQDTPALRMIEANCVQCGLCEKACPESAITLEARYVWDSVHARRINTLHEEMPFNCISCQKPFATARMIDTMLDKLGGHWMFNNRKAMERLKMCEDCRVMAIFEDHPEGVNVHVGDKPPA